MKNVLRVKGLAKVLKLRNALRSGLEGSNDTNQPVEVKQEFVLKAIEDVRVFIYVVQEADTLSSIARKFNMSVIDIIFANQLYSGQEVYTGQALYIYMNDSTPIVDEEDKLQNQGRSLFPADDESTVRQLSSYKLLLSSLRVNRDYSMCKEPQIIEASAARAPTALQLSMRLSTTGLLDEFRESIIYAHKDRNYPGVLSGSPTLIVFDANWDAPIVENGLIDYQLVIKTSDVLVCHVFEDKADEADAEEPELQFDLNDNGGERSAESYLQLTVVKPGADPRVVRFKGLSDRVDLLFKKIMAWTGKPIVNPLSASVSTSSYFLSRDAFASPFPTPPVSARTSPVLRAASGFAPYTRESSGSNMDSVFSPSLPAKLLAQHQPEQSVQKEPVSYVTKTGKVIGVLTVTSSMAVFEPNLNDPAVVSGGLLANQINFFMADVFDCLLLNEGTEKPSMQIFLREGSSEKSVIFEGEGEKVANLSTQIKQQMAGRPKPNISALQVPTTKPVSVPSSPTHLLSPGSNSPPGGSSLPSSPGSFISSLRSTAIGKFGVFEKLASRSPSSGDTTPGEPNLDDDDEFEPGSPGLQSDLIRSIESFVPKMDGESQILTIEWIQFLRRYVRARDIYRDWKLLYSTEKHGISMNTMYARVQDKGAMFIVVEDTKGYVFGGYASEPLHPSRGYYGTGESFLFRLRPQLDVYPWPNTNSFFILSTEHFLSMGGGENGKYGLYMDSDFSKGTSDFCNTFHNQPLASSEFFECTLMEIWGFEHN